MPRGSFARKFEEPVVPRTPKEEFDDMMKTREAARRKKKEEVKSDVEEHMPRSSRRPHVPHVPKEDISEVRKRIEARFGNRSESAVIEQMSHAAHPEEMPSEKVQIRQPKRKEEPAFASEEEAWFESRKKREASSNPFQTEDEPGSALVRNKKTGFIETLRADERFITLREAYQYLADKQMDLTERKMALQGSNAMSKEAKRALEDEQRALDRFRREVDESDETDAARAARYSGASLLIENPMYQEEEIPVKDEDLEDVTYADYKKSKEKYTPEQERMELDALYRKRNELKRAADAMLDDMKKTGRTEEVFAGFARAGADMYDQPVHYPNYFPADIKKAQHREKLLREAEELETEAERKKQLPVVAKKKMAQQWELENLRSEIAKLKAHDTISYPNETGKEKARTQKLAELKAREAALVAEVEPHTKSSMNAAHREILDELDRVEMAILKQEQNLRYSQHHEK